MSRPSFAPSRLFLAIGLVMSAAIMTPMLHAQFRGSLRGTVTDPRGAVVPGTQVHE